MARSHVVGLFALLAVASCSARDRREGTGGAGALRSVPQPRLPIGGPTLVRAFTRDATPDRFVLRDHQVTSFFDGEGFVLAAVGARVRMRLLGAHGAAPTPDTPARAHVREGTRDVQAFERLVWRDTYPGVDMQVEPVARGFEYRFAVSAGASVEPIALRFEGARELRPSDDGRSLSLVTDAGVVHIDGLRAYADEPGGRRELPVRHTIDGNEVHLRVDGWSGRVPLIIDPVVTWGSYLGGSAADVAGSVAVDASGNVFIAGSTASTNFPTTSGLDTTFNLGGDGYVTKVSPTGTLLWSTYLGGAGGDEVRGMAIDPSGNVIVTGVTTSADFPTTTGLDTARGGLSDAFVTKLTTSGTVVWSTFFGGGADEDGAAIAADSAGNVVITGGTSSTDFPSVPTSTTTPPSNSNAFIARFNASGVPQLAFPFGGSAIDRGAAIAVDATGAIVVTGATESYNFPVKDAFLSTYPREDVATFQIAVFLTKYSSTGTLAWSTFVGIGGSRGGAPEGAGDIAIDSRGDIFIAGTTDSAEFVTTGGFETTFPTCPRGGCGSGAFLTKFTSAGALAWSTYFGAFAGGSGGGVGVTPENDVYLVGSLYSAHTMIGGFDTTAGSGGYIARVSSEGKLIWSSYLGGAGSSPHDVALDSKHNVYVVGSTTSTTFPASTGFDPSYNGAGDAFLFRYTPSSARGGTCAASVDCATGRCTDGVCCDRACNGTCEACKATMTGAADGTCAPVTRDTDPRNDCTPGTSTCSAPGVCDGAGNCRSFATAGTACGVGSCIDGVLTSKVCRGDAALCIEVKTSCAPYACGTTACLTSCTTSAECAESAYCNAGACTAKRTNGQACSTGGECASGSCADGVCCNRACTGRCESCAESASAGTCTAVMGDPRGSRPKCGGSAECPGTCDGVNGATCSFPLGKVCSSSCSGSSETIGLCSSDGSCNVGAPKKCNGFACDGSARCRTSCSSSADCDTDYACDAGKCVPATAKCSEDLTSVTDRGGRATLCAPYKCNSEAGACRSSCATDSDCAAGSVCTSGNVCAAAEATASDGGCHVATASGRSSGALVAIAGLLLMQLNRRRTRKGRDR